jgi:peptide/nickel transport system substrate-binding protein
MRGLAASAVLLALSASALSTAACDNGEAPDRGPAEVDPTTITVLTPGDEAVLGPAWDEEPKFLVFLPFAQLDENGDPVGRLARRWEHSEDYRTWTYHLRTDVRWHDGVPVTAHDVKFTIDLLNHPAAEYYPPGAVTAIVVNDSTVALSYEEVPSTEPSLDLWWTVFYPKHLLSELDPAAFKQWEFWKQPVGNGPYRYVRHVPQTMMELEANSDYYAGVPRIGRVVLKFGVPGNSANIAELLSGNVDAVPYVNRFDLLALDDDSRFRNYYQINQILVRAIFWNQGHPILGNATVRRALTLAIDRREMLQVLNMPEDIPIADGPYSSRQLRRGELVEALSFDAAGARRLLDEAGWRDEDGDGVRERDGRALRFEAILSPLPGWEEMAVYIQDRLRRVGVQMEVLLLEGQAARSRVLRGEVDAVFALFENSTVFLERVFSEGSTRSYRNAELDRLIDLLKEAIDPDSRDRIYSEMTEIFQRDVPVTFLVPRVNTVVAHQRVRGLSSPYRAFPCRHMDELWIEDDGGGG